MNKIYWLTKHFVTDEPPEKIERIGAFSKQEYAKMFCNAAEAGYEESVDWMDAFMDDSAIISDVFSRGYWYKITAVIIP